MTRDLDTMAKIQHEKDREIDAARMQPLNPEGVTMAKYKRFTIDMVGVPVDPLR